LTTAARRDGYDSINEWLEFLCRSEMREQQQQPRPQKLYDDDDVDFEKPPRKAELYDDL
jgi:hypothetical protein